jgi:hypothetical protein
MTFTRVFNSADEKRKTMHGFQISLNREKLNEKDEEGYKIQLMRCLFFKKTDVKVEREEKLTH